MDALFQDFRYALRQLRRSPGFTVVAVLTLALGIGANTLVYSLVEAAYLRPLPWPQAERLVAVSESTPGGGLNALSYANFHDWQEGARSFEAMAAYGGGSFNLAGGAEAEHVSGAVVTPSLFAVLRVAPMLGRTLVPEDARPGAGPTVVLSHALWSTRFAADSSLVGRGVLLDGVPHTVVGVMPPEFGFPADERLWTPLVADPGVGRGSHWLWGIGRLREGANAAEAERELNSIARRLGEEYPETNADWGARVEDVRGAMLGARDADKMLALMAGAVAFVLLIVCANLMNLLLAKGSGRGREVAVRAALGAGRARIVRQLLTESVLLAALGGTGGVLLAWWGVELLAATLPTFVPSWFQLAVHARTLGFTALLALGTTLLFGLLPALRATRPELQPTLRSAGPGVGHSPERSRLGSALVVAQIALSLVLLVGASLVVRNLLALQRVNPGFEREGVVAVRLTLAGPAYEREAGRSAFWQALLSRLDGLPGVRAHGAVGSLPLTGNYSTSGFEGEGQGIEQGRWPTAQLYPVAGDYLAAMGIPLLRGRRFTETEQWDSTTRLVLVNAAAAESAWPGQDPLGRRLRLGTARDDPWYTVVGVVGNVRHASLGNDWTRHQIYFPYGSRPRSGMSVVARIAGDPAAAATALRRAVAAVDPSLAAYDVATMDQVYRDSLYLERLYVWMFGSFGVGALLLALVGVYGVTSHSVGQRTYEMGVRIAFGASAHQIVALVLKRTIRLAFAGVALGTAAALLAGRMLAALLYGVQPTDPVTFVAVPLLLAATALTAAYLPARRATRVDPKITLRTE